jgi:tRNA1Val (adenine37-N6)-methyltransferase
VNVDTLLLAAFAACGRPRARCVVDLGAGVGALGLAYARLARAGHLELVERLPDLAELALRNLHDTGAPGTVHLGDLAERGLPDELKGRADVVLSNPPFFDERDGKRGRADRAGTRRGKIEPFLRAASRALGRRATSFFVYPAPALPEFFGSARAADLVPKRLRLVHPFATSPARIALVELRRAKLGGLVVEPPLVEWAARGVRSDEVEALVSGKQ